MGELIAFRLPKNALRPRRAQRRWATILFFTGVRRETMGRDNNGEGAPPAKRAPRASGKDAASNLGKPSRKSRGGAESGAPGLADSD